jgi:hypothetical protein
MSEEQFLLPNMSDEQILLAHNITLFNLDVELEQARGDFRLESLIRDVYHGHEIESHLVNIGFLDPKFIDLAINSLKRIDFDLSLIEISSIESEQIQKSILKTRQFYDEFQALVEETQQKSKFFKKISKFGQNCDLLKSAFF